MCWLSKLKAMPPAVGFAVKASELVNQSPPNSSPMTMKQIRMVECRGREQVQAKLELFRLPALQGGRLDRGHIQT